jgi:hypothetical protein
MISRAMRTIAWGPILERGIGVVSCNFISLVFISCV